MNLTNSAVAPQSSSGKHFRPHRKGYKIKQRKAMACRYRTSDVGFKNRSEEMEMRSLHGSSRGSRAVKSQRDFDICPNYPLGFQGMNHFGIFFFFPLFGCMRTCLGLVR
jgi:hypothetical protein